MHTLSPDSTLDSIRTDDEIYDVRTTVREAYFRTLIRPCANHIYTSFAEVRANSGRQQIRKDLEKVGPVE